MSPLLGALLDRIRDGALTTYRMFGAPGELSELVLDDLAVLLTERFQSGRDSARDLPDGTVTFVFVDMAESTQIARELPTAYPEIVETFQSTLAETVGRHGGVVVDTEGDGAFCVFPRVDHAATAAVAFQRDVMGRSWPGAASVLARIGIHTGTAERTANNYVGLEVHRAARIGAAANGGQILVSRSAANLLGMGSLVVWQLADLGAFALKGLDRAEELLQLTAPELPDELQTPRARGTRSVHLPAQLTGLVGRDDDVAHAAQILERHDVRLVTLTGPGGIGKTRLGVATAARAADAYPDGVFFVPLADTRTTDDVVGAIAAALGLRSEGARALLSTIEDRLAAGRALLVLDNFEQVVEARTVVVQLLGSCPGVDLVVTSRTPLRIRGETELPVPPLGSSAAVRLFLERAQAPGPAGIRHLTSLPSSRRSAAASTAYRSRSSSPPRGCAFSIPCRSWTASSRKLDVVGGSVPDLPERQRTLTATIEWSYDLLDPAERALLPRLAVFVGGWTLEAAEAVCAGGVVSDVLAAPRAPQRAQPARRRAGSGRRPADADARDDPGVRVGPARGRDEADALRERHASYYESMIVELHTQPGGETAPVSMARLDDDWDDVVACMEWRFVQNDYAQLVRLVSHTWRYMWLRDRFNALMPRLRAAYAARETLEPALRGELCRLWAGGCYQAGRFEEARDANEEAVRLLAEAGPIDREAWARTLLGGPVALLRRRPRAAVRRGVASSRALPGRAERVRTGPDARNARHRLGAPRSDGRGDGSVRGGHRRGRAARARGAHRLPPFPPSARTRRNRRRRGCSAPPRRSRRGAALPRGHGSLLRGLRSSAGRGRRRRPRRDSARCGRGPQGTHGRRQWPIVDMILRDRVASLESAGPDAAAARFAGSQMSPAEALACIRTG